MVPNITAEDTKKLALKMRDRFLLPFAIEDQLIEITEICQSLPDEFRPQGKAFIDSLLAVHATTSLPYQLAQSKASALHFQRIHMAERIRSLPVHDEDYEISEDERDRNALTAANEKYSAFSKSEDGINALVADLASTLLKAIEQPSTAKAADELLYQAVVGLWSAFEILVRDELIVLLNSHPAIATQLLNNSCSKKYFELPKLSIEELSETKYDLSSCMGDFILGTRDFSDVRIIKSAFSAISSDGKLIEFLNDDNLWQLNQCRHLIVHRRGVVDAKYKASTECQLPIGERVSVTPQDVDKYFKVVIQSATAILSGIATVAS